MLLLIDATHMGKKQTETEFGSQFIQSGNLRKIIRNPYYIREFETLNGIPDLVLVPDTKFQHFKDFEKRYARISSTSGTARILAVLNKKSFISEIELLRITGLSKSYLSKITRALIHIDAVEYESGRGFRVCSDFDVPSPRIVSIEFKLDNWQKALVQAPRHSAFASRSYVIMPSNKHSLLEKNVKHFQTFGISVGTFDTESGKFNMVWKAPAPYRGKSKSKVSYLDSLYRVLNSLDRLETVAV